MSTAVVSARRRDRSVLGMAPRTAVALLLAKSYSVVSLLRLGMPIPTGLPEDLEGSAAAGDLARP